MNELLYLELRSSYSPDELLQLKTFAAHICVELSCSPVQDSVSPEIWESLTGFEFGQVDPGYRKQVIERAFLQLNDMFRLATD